MMRKPALTYRDNGTTGTQLDAMSGDVRIGRISKDVLSLRTVVSWSWTIYIDPGRPSSNGTAALTRARRLRPGLSGTGSLWLNAAGLNDADTK
jgi:hypothetical protein